MAGEVQRQGDLIPHSSSLSTFKISELHGVLHLAGRKNVYYR